VIKMVEKHSQSFFGQSTGLTLLSSSKSDPFIFLKCIKKKSDGSWEKPSLGEGKTIKCNLDEIIMILEVFKRTSDSWSSYHNFNDVKTQISFKWEDGVKKKLLIYIGNYSKMLNFSQTEIFRLLLKHILEEKIEFATISKMPSGKAVVSGQKNNEQRNQDNNATVLPVVKESIENKENEVSQINGVIEGETEKALLIQFNKDKEIWIPKSVIRSNYDSSNDISQNFIIDNWILKKNNIPN
jgi:PII-like signaling protein